MPQDKRKLARYYTYLSKQNGTPFLTAFGLELLNPNDRVLFLTEGVFDAAPFHMLRKNALALLGNNPKPLASWLMSMGYHLVAVTDGDEAGQKLRSFSQEFVTCPSGLDPAAMGLEWCESVAEQF